MDVLHILSVLVLLTVVSVDSLMFHLAANQKKCLKEEIHKDVLVTGEYQLSDVPGHKTQLLVLTTLCLFMESLYHRGSFSVFHAVQPRSTPVCILYHP